MAYLPHPLSPPLLPRRRGRFIKKGLATLLNTSMQVYLIYNEEESKRGEASLIYLIPPALIREGDKGEGLPNPKMWRRGWDSNPRSGNPTRALQARLIGHSSTSPQNTI